MINVPLKSSLTVCFFLSLVFSYFDSFLFQQFVLVSDNISMAILKYHRAETSVSPHRDFSLIALKL